MKEKDNSEVLNLLSGPLWNKLLIIALPMALTGILQQLFNAADIAVVGNFIEDPDVAKAAVAAVGSNSPIVNLVVTLFIGLSIGTNVIIAQYIGQGNPKNIHKAISTSVIIAIVGGLIFGLGSQFFVNNIIQIMGVPADVFDLATIYLRIYLLGLPVIFLYNFETAIFRSIGNTRTPLIVLAVSGILNVILNIFFVTVIKMTVSGVALATVLSNLVSSVILFILLCKSDDVIKINPKKIRFDSFSFDQIIKIGLPAGVQGMVFALANICIQSAVNSLGTEVMAGSAAALNLELFSYYIMTSFGQACTTLVGQNYGAGEYDRCQRSLTVSLLFASIAYVLLVTILLVFGPQLLSLFNSDTDVIANGMIRIRFMLLGHAFSMIQEVITGYLRGFGISTVPAVCTLIFVCGVRIIWVFLIFPFHRDFTFLMLVYPISLFINAVAIVAIYFMMRKRLKEKTEQMRLTVES